MKLALLDVFEEYKFSQPFETYILHIELSSFYVSSGLKKLAGPCSAPGCDLEPLSCRSHHDHPLPIVRCSSPRTSTLDTLSAREAYSCLV